MSRKPKSPEKMKTAQFFGQPEQLEFLNEASFKAFMQASRLYADGMSVFGGEMLRFMSRRWQQDMEFGRSLTKCDEWNKIAAVQQDWAGKAVEDYLDEASRLAELASKVTMESWQPLYETATSAADETLARAFESARR